MDPADREAQKQASRDADAQALADGSKTREQLREENSHFRDVAHDPIDWDRTQLFDPEERAAEKQCSRDEDAEALRTGTKTREQLRKENGAFAFPDAVVHLDDCKKLG